MYTCTQIVNKSVCHVTKPLGLSIKQTDRCISATCTSDTPRIATDDENGKSVTDTADIAFN